MACVDDQRSNRSLQQSTGIIYQVQVYSKSVYTSLASLGQSLRSLACKVRILLVTRKTSKYLINTRRREESRAKDRIRENTTGTYYIALY